MPRAPAPVLRVSLLSRSTLFVISPALLLFALIPLALLVWKPGNSAFPWVLFGPCVALLVLLMTRWALTHVEVGRDGVLLRSMGKQRFLPFVAIASIADRGEDILFVLSSGEEVVVRTGKEGQFGKPRYVAQCEELVARIDSQLERRRLRESDDAAPDGHVLLAHARRALGEGGDDPQSYRAHALPPKDELWRIVVDPDADEIARASAAVMLRREPEAKTRLRASADETVSPHLRKLLRVAADDDADREVARALDACARDGSQR